MPKNIRRKTISSNSSTSESKQTMKQSKFLRFKINNLIQKLSPEQVEDLKIFIDPYLETEKELTSMIAATPERKLQELYEEIDRLLENKIETI